MPNTKSAERRARNSERKNLENRSRKSGLKTQERKYLDLVGAAKKEDAGQALRAVSAALDKAAKAGVIPQARADRKKSRLALRLNKVA